MKRIYCLLGVVLLVVAAIPALADSIVPSSQTGSLAVGGSMTVTKAVTVSSGPATTSKVDVFFLSDTTGSMGGAIGTVAASASSILSSTAGLGDVYFGVGEYKDFGDAYAYRLNTAFTNNQATAQAGINMWGASGGGDYQEANLYALNSLATGSEEGWRTGSAKILIWMGDASGHDPSGGITEAMATSALVADGIKAYPIDVGNLNDTGQAGRIATATGGTLYTGINTSTLVSTITDAISASIANYTTVGLDLSEAPAGVGVVATPGGYTGTFDRSMNRTFNFDVTFTGVTEGTYGFNIYALVDGGRVATESDSITVGAVPEPGSITLLGTVLLGLATAIYRRRRKA